VQSTVDAATDQPSTPAPEFTDATTGDRWMLVPVTFQVPHPITQLPERAWTISIYMHASIGGDPNTAMAALQDAITRLWFVEHGTPAVAPTADKNGTVAANMQPWFVAACNECNQEHSFTDRLQRARWMGEHSGSTGHHTTWSDVERPRQGEVASDGSQGQSDVQEGHQGI